MRKRKLGSFGSRVLVLLLAFSMSFMMVPAVAFAEIGGETYEVEVDASEGDASYTTGEDVAATFKPAVGVVADNGNTAEVVVGNVTKESGFQHVVMVEADNDGTANVAMGDVTGRLKWGGNGIDVSTKGGDVEMTAGNVTACKVGLNLDNAPTGVLADYTGEKRVTVDSVTQTEDSRYSNAGINAFSYISGDKNVVQVKGDVKAAGSRGIDVLAKGSSETSVAVSGMVNANYLGVKMEAGCLGNVNGTTVSTGTATVHVGGVASENWDKGVEIDSNTQGSTATFESDGDVKALGSDSTGVFVRSVGGKSNVLVDGDVSGKQAGLFIYCNETGSNDVLVTGTISGKNGVDISYNSVENDSLTVWKIEKASNGQYVSGEEVNTPSDDREVFAKKRINYIVYLEKLAEGGTIAALKSNGTALDKSHGYDVAREGEKVIVKVDLEAGYELECVYNGKGELVPLAKDDDGNYYVMVERGGGIYLSAVLKGSGEEFTVVPPPSVLVTTVGQDIGNAVATDTAATGRAHAVDAGNAGSSEEGNANAIDAPWPLLTYDGVQINEVKLEMDGQVPILRTTLTNTNNRDVEFDCTKFKVVNVDDDSEIAFKTEVKELKANASAKCEFEADENAMKPGDRAYVFYDGQLLGTFTVA